MMKPRNIRQKGFTLIEVMIVIAIIGVLAAIAIPQYSRFVATSRRVEGFHLLNGLKVAETVYYSEKEIYDDNIVAVWAQSGFNTTPRYYVHSGLASIVPISWTSDDWHRGYVIAIGGNIDSDIIADYLTLAVGGPHVTAIPPFSTYTNGIYITQDDVLLN